MDLDWFISPSDDELGFTPYDRMMYLDYAFQRLEQSEIAALLKAYDPKLIAYIRSGKIADRKARGGSGTE